MPNWIACWPKAFLRAKLPEKIRLICNKFFLYERLACPQRSMHGVPASAGCASGEAQPVAYSFALPAKAGTPCRDRRLLLNNYIPRGEGGTRRRDGLHP